MPDIAKCSNEECPNKNKCYRYTCEPSDFWQSYMEFKPDKKGICLDWLPIYDNDKNNDNNIW